MHEEPKLCRNPYCGKVLIQREGESPSLWKARITCGKDCAKELSSNKGKKRNPGFIYG